MIVVLNPIVQSISGRLGNLVFYSSGRIQYARRYVVPRNPDTAAQRSRRELFASAVAAWQGLPAYKKEQCNRRAVRRRICGYNLFISEKLKPGNQDADSSCSPIGLIKGLSVSPVSSAAVSCYPRVCPAESEHYAAGKQVFAPS